jgi:hypothetical protein
VVTVISYVTPARPFLRDPVSTVPSCIPAAIAIHRQLTSLKEKAAVNNLQVTKHLSKYRYRPTGYRLNLKVHRRTGREGPEVGATLSLTLALGGVCGQRHEPVAINPGKETRYALYRRLGGPQGQERKIAYHPRHKATAGGRSKGSNPSHYAVEHN